MTGPGIPQTQNLFQQSGAVPVILFFVFFAIVSTLCSLFIIEAMQAIPGNKHFQGTAEFSTLINFYFGPWAHLAGQFCLYGSLISPAVASIVLSTQTFDNILSEIFHASCGLSMGPERPGWICTNTIQGLEAPFGQNYTLFTIGFLLTILVVAPLSLIDMAENMNLQIGSFIMTFFIFAEWIVASFIYGFGKANIPAVGDSSGFTGLVGIVMMNFAFVSTVPSWINVKKNSVNVQNSLWCSTMLAMFAYIAVGYIPGRTFYIPSNSNLIAVLMGTTLYNRIFAYAFTLIILLPSIPVNFIMACNNITQNFDLSTNQARILTHVMPFIYAIPLFQGHQLTNFNIWSSLIFVSTANFIIPLLIYLRARVFRREYNQTRVREHLVDSSALSIDSQNQGSSLNRLPPSIRRNSVATARKNSTAAPSSNLRHGFRSELSIANANTSHRMVNRGLSNPSFLSPSLVVEDETGSSIHSVTINEEPVTQPNPNRLNSHVSATSLSSAAQMISILVQDEDGSSPASETKPVKPSSLNLGAENVTGILRNSRSGSIKSSVDSRRSSDSKGYMSAPLPPPAIKTTTGSIDLNSELNFPALNDPLADIEPYLLEDVPDPEHEDEEDRKVEELSQALVSMNPDMLMVPPATATPPGIGKRINMATFVAMTTPPGQGNKTNVAVTTSDESILQPTSSETLGGQAKSKSLLSLTNQPLTVSPRISLRSVKLAIKATSMDEFPVQTLVSPIFQRKPSQNQLQDCRFPPSTTEITSMDRIHHALIQILTDLHLASHRRN
ncbi:hypothetical protein HDU76_001180 [Blyttiomyces sp. JEL0837]|nr:hypothetical protein HDU76_001180 [Blyttiomyces sp. JEL0837]